MRSFSQMGGRALGSSGSPSMSGLGPSGVRAQPAVMPVPNTVPAGVQTGAPPRVQFFNRLVIPASTRKATLLVAGTPENRIFIVTAPGNAFTVYIGGPDVTPSNGMAIPPGQPFDVPLVGLQEVWAVTDSPVYQRVQCLVSIVLMAEQGRPVGRIGNE